MLRWRLLLGVVFVAALVGLLWGDYYLEQQGYGQAKILRYVAVLISVFGTMEYLAIVRIRDPQVPTILPWLNFGIVLCSALGQSTNIMVGAFVCSFFVMVLIEFYRYDKDTSKQVTERLAVGVFGLFYLGLLMGFVVRLRLSPYGLLPLVSMLAIVKLGDIGAYTVGRLFGRHKLCPKLSPGKTIEGLFGALLFGLIGAAVVGYFWAPEWPASTHVGWARDWDRIQAWLVVGPVLALVGAGGDLVESLLKRDYGRKDSSDWMPGFGGVLDLIDSPLIAAPVAWALWEAPSLIAPSAGRMMTGVGN